jgi:hypothetical protein
MFSPLSVLRTGALGPRFVASRTALLEDARLADTPLLPEESAWSVALGAFRNPVTIPTP